MSFVNAENQKKIKTIVNSVTTFADIVDNPGACDDIPGLDCEPGLGMHTEAESFRTMSKDIEEGVFKTLVMGKFKNGKSTFINALVGKLLMAAKATACTAVIATVSFGEDTNSVYVHYKDQDSPRRMTLEHFTREFQLDEDDQAKLENGENLDRFADVSYVEMHSDDKMFADGLSLIDSPGLEEANSRTVTTTEFVPKANAIIFMLNAISLFSEKEKQYISMNFAGKHMRNLFFVVNRINQVTGEGDVEKFVKPSVKNNLREVFTDENGRFDEELYNSRVFFVDAYGALCASTGQPYKVLIGNREMEATITKEDSGMIEFENALVDFLNSPERLNATFSSTMTGMANTYKSALNKAEADKSVRSTSKEERLRRAEDAKVELENAQKKVESIRQTVRRTGENISSKIYNDLIGYIQMNLKREFSAYIESGNKPKFGMVDMLRLASATLAQKFGSDESKRRWAKKNEDILRPTVNYVNEYIQKGIENWSKGVNTLISQDTRDLQEELEDQSREFDLSLDRAVNLFAYGNAETIKNQGAGAKAGLQAVLALATNFDVSLAVEGMAKGGMSWLDFAKRYAVQIVIDTAVTLIFGAPYLIPIAAVEAISMSYRAGKTGDELIKMIGERAFEKLGEKIKEKELDFKDDIIKQFVENGEKTASTAQGLLDDAQANMDRLVAEDADDTAAAEAENERVDKNLKLMHDCIDSVYSELYGHKPNEMEFANLGRNEEKK